MCSRRGFKEAVATVLKCCTAARDNIDDSFQREVGLRCTLRAWPTHCYKTKKVRETIAFLLATLPNIRRLYFFHSQTQQ